MNNGGVGAGKRATPKETAYKTVDSRAKIDFDPKGKKIFDGYAPGENFKSKKGADLAGEIQQAAQDAPEAIEQQRIPRAYRDTAKGYFQQLRGGSDAAPAEKK